MKISRQSYFFFGSFAFLAAVFFGVFSEVVLAQVQLPPAIEIRQTAQYDVFLVTSLDNLESVPQEVTIYNLEGFSETKALNWVGLIGSNEISAYVLAAGNDVEMHINTTLALITGMQSQAWQVLPSAKGWGRPWTKLIGIQAGQPATVTTGSSMIFTMTVENGSQLTGQNMPVLATYSRTLNRTSGFPWVANDRYIQPVPNGSYTGTITYVPIIRPGERKAVRLEFRAIRVGGYLLDTCVLQIEGTDEGAVNCQGARGVVTGYEDFMPIVMQ